MCEPTPATAAATGESPKAQTPGHAVFVGWDHAVAVSIQDTVVSTLAQHPLVRSVKSFGPRDTSIRVDYPDVAAEVCSNNIGGVDSNGNKCVGILICGSGIGMSIAANKVPGIRAALCHDNYTAQMCRRHNDANVLCAGARSTGLDIILDMIHQFLTVGFEGGRHANRVGKIDALHPKRSSSASAPAAAGEEEKK